MTRADDSARFYQSLCDLLERRVNLIIGRAKFGPARFVGPVYDPTMGSGGDGWACAKCRRTVRSDRRLCGSCGYINR